MAPHGVCLCSLVPSSSTEEEYRKLFISNPVMCVV